MKNMNTDSWEWKVFSEPSPQDGVSVWRVSPDRASRQAVAWHMDDADAALIAAAPELLAACKDVLGYFLHTRHGAEWRQGGGTEHELLTAAIARAEGRSTDNAVS